jgi:hypothetical protein
MLCLAQKQSHPPLFKNLALTSRKKIELTSKEHRFVKESSIHHLFTTFCAISAVAIIVDYAYPFEQGSVATYCV